MKTKTINLYEFKELSKEAQEKAIENLRDINTDHEWYKFTLKDYQEKLNKIGFLSAEIHFSGFCSQGDGANFDAKIDLAKAIEHLGTKKYNRLVNGQTDCFINYIDATIEKNTCATHYSHERTRYVSLEFRLNDFPHVFALIEELESDIEALRLELCKDIYKDLKDEYNYLISEKAIIETIEVNEYTFLENGTLENY